MEEFGTGNLVTSEKRNTLISYFIIALCLAVIRTRSEVFMNLESTSGCAFVPRDIWAHSFESINSPQVATVRELTCEHPTPVNCVLLSLDCQETCLFG